MPSTPHHVAGAQGLRTADLVRITSQLKLDFARQIGPKSQRRAALIFEAWKAEGLKALKKADEGVMAPSVLGLALFQPDEAQICFLHRLVSRLPECIQHYLCQHVFPDCMNFQGLKISACGHELGSHILFSRCVGFSGTPSNLLPRDLGQCRYEKGSDGQIVHVLTSPDVVTSTLLGEEWNSQQLLQLIGAEGQYHALIDTGALITGMENDEVTRRYGRLYVSLVLTSGGQDDAACPAPVVPGSSVPGPQRQEGSD